MLSKKVYRTKYAISRVIDKLEKDGLVEIEQQSSSSDKRFKKVFITQKGIEFLRTRMPERRRLAKEATSFLNSEEMYSLGKLSRKLRKHLLEKISSENSSE
jgi:DNA-binding MarR family transcriptional regulator